MNDKALFADWVRTVRDLARRCGVGDALEGLDAELVHLHHDAVQLVVAGGPNSGKSTAINQLLGRGVLPVSARRSLAGFAVSAGAEEQALVDGEARPLSALAVLAQRPPSATVEIALADDWLRSAGIRIVESPALDAADEDLEAAVHAILDGADLVLVLVDAQRPVTRADAALLAECARRQLPTIVAVSKVDQLAAEERDTVLDYVHKHVAAAGLEPPVVVAEGRSSAGGLRALVDDRLAATDFAAVRFQQAEDALLEALATVALVAQAGVEERAASSTKSAEETRKRAEGVEALAVVWMQLEHALRTRRRRLEDQLRDGLEKNRASTFDALCFELERCGDVQTWWTHDLPYRLQRELRAVATHTSSSIVRQAAADVRWLQEELHRRLKLPLAVPLAEPAMAVEEVGFEAPAPLPLTDMGRFRVMSRVGTAATLLLAGMTFAHAGLAGATIAASSVAGLLAELLSKRVVARDRSAVRSDLDRVVQRAWLDYSMEVTAQLTRGYEEIVGALKKEQEQWRTRQAEAQRSAVAGGATVDWQLLLEQAQSLAAEIGGRRSQP